MGFMTPIEALRKAIETAGSQTALAEAVGTTQPRVSEWLNEAGQASAVFALRIEQATGVSRHDLRPDVFGEAPAREDAGAAA